MEAAIEVRGLTVRYGRTIGVRDLSFEVAAGEVFGFLGPNGAGKTTTIRTLMDLLRPTEGRATVLGLDSRLDAVELHRRVGYLPGELELYEDLTGEALLGAFARLRGGVRTGLVDSLASRLGADLRRPIGSLSHGNRRKVGLVQALMHEPELLLLDEPSEGLDPLVQHALYDIIAEARGRGVTVFLSSHNLPEVQRVCDRVGIIRGGSLIAIEGVEDLLARSFTDLELRFARPVPAERFAALEGVTEALPLGDAIRLRVEGSVDAVIKEAATHEVLSIETREPSLEAAFLAYYGGDDAD